MNSVQNTERILFYGYGNPGRADDGLGITFCYQLKEYVRENQISGVEFSEDYQLNIEDGETISRFDSVFFVDATKNENVERWLLTTLSRSKELAFTTHHVSPEFLLGICQTLYNKNPNIQLLTIRGYKWDLHEGISSEALSNLKSALHFIQLQLMKRDAKALPSQGRA